MKDHHQTGRRYDAQFKQDAVALVHAGRPYTRVARELGVSSLALSRWLLAAAAAQTSAPSRAPHASSEAEELRRLRRELADTRLQRDILKKALAICSTPNPRLVSR